MPSDVTITVKMATSLRCITGGLAEIETSSTFSGVDVDVGVPACSIRTQPMSSIQISKFPFLSDEKTISFPSGDHANPSPPSFALSFVNWTIFGSPPAITS